MPIPATARDLEDEGAKLFESPAGSVALRTFQSLATGLVAVALFGASLFIPAVSSLLGVSRLEGAVACGLVYAGLIFATVAYWIAGLSRFYLWAEYTESVLAAAAYAYLIYASGTPQSFFWFLYVVHVFMMAVSGSSLRNGVLLGAVPAALALGYGLSGNAAGALLSLVAGGFGVPLYLIVARSFDELERLRRHESELKGKLADLRVAQERNRIASDLHDGVGAQLAGLTWRVRGLASEPASAPSNAELERLEERARETIAELRDVVLALRRQSMSWEETTALLANRCREMCGTIQFDLVAEGVPDSRTLDAVFPELLRIIFELVRNAVRHAAPSRVEVKINAADELSLTITDDGRGFESTVATESQGGLGNVRRRVDELGGRLEVASGGRGTRIDVALPMVSEQAHRPAANPSAVDKSEHVDPVLEIPTTHAMVRSAAGVAGVLLAAAAAQSALFVPAVARMVGVGPADGAIAASLFVVGLTVATVSYYLSGSSRLYLWAEYLESTLTAAGYSYLILASGTPQSAFWFIYLVHCFILTPNGTSLRNSILVGVAPAAVALGFAVQGQIAAAVVSLLGGAFGELVYLTVAKSFDEIEAARRRATQLRTNLAQLSVAKERDRIATDLRNSIGAHLADLVSRVRGFTSESESALAPAELEILEQRVRSATEELYEVVLALRRKPELTSIFVEPHRL